MESMDSPKLNEKLHKSTNSHSGAISKRQQSQHQNDISKDDIEASTSQLLEKVKTDRVAVTKPEEDWRRRTIIVEKKNGSYGFTLQSYGIHYKKEQEIEMITYVDYVEFDGPAYRSGMREGDVILSINGVDMEKADHKTLVNFIKNCDTRMRMVVLFEDCVRKVELHIRYIELQKILQEKMNELERLCVRERELLDGKWKTHSLPSQRKKTTNEAGDETPVDDDGPSFAYCRPTVSTEDMASKHNHGQVMLTYQYIDAGYRHYFLQPSTSRSGDYVVSLGPPRSRSDHHHFIVKTPCDSQGISITSRPIQGNFNHNQSNGVNNNACNNKSTKKSSHNHSHRCNPCYPPQNNQDSASLEAYDLASPCCDPHCVPSTRRRMRHHKHHDKEHHHHHHHRKKDKNKEPQKENNKRESSSQTRSKSQCQSVASQSVPRYRYLNFGAGLVSQCSLQSCTSSEVSVTVPTCESSVASYTTSLSTDTLYWDNQDRHSRTPPKMQNLNHHHHQVYQPQCKPKSWDNLTTKAFGGYGFGYGYSDTSKQNAKGHNRAHSTKSTQEHRNHRHSINEKQIQHGMYVHHHTHHRYTPPTKSTESLLGVNKYHDPTLSDSSLSCECLDVASPDSTLKSTGRFFLRNSGSMAASPTSQRNMGYYSQHILQPQLKRNQNIPSTSSEITRL